MNLTRAERETIILYNEEEQTAEVYTCNEAMKRKLTKLHEDGTEGITFVRSDEYNVTYTVPKKWVKINPPRILSEAQRQVLIKARESRIQIQAAHTHENQK